MLPEHHHPQCRIAFKVGLPVAPNGNKSAVRVAAQRCQILGLEEKNNQRKRQMKKEVQNSPRYNVVKL